MAAVTGTIVVRWGLAGEEILAPLGPTTGAELRRWLVEQKKVSERYTLKLSVPASPEQSEDQILLDDEVLLAGSVVHAIIKNGPSRFYMSNPQTTTAKLGQKMNSYTTNEDASAAVLDPEDDFSGWHSSEGQILVPDRPIRDLQSADVPLELREKVLELAKLIEGIGLPGGESEYRGVAFALFKREDLTESLLEALGINESIEGEATLEEKEFRSSFTFCNDEDENDLQESSNDEYKRLVSATNMLKKFGKTYELNFTEEVAVAPVLYLAVNEDTDEIIGIFGGRVWT